MNRLLAVLLLAAIAAPVQAQLEITISGGEETAQPIALVPFRGLDTVSLDVAKVIENDLARTGLFKPVGRELMLEKPYDIAQVNYANWRAIAADTVVVGQLTPAADGRIGARFYLLDAVRQQQLLGFDMPPVPPARLRSLAHQMADLIFEKLTGIRGAFNTRIAYVSATGYGYQRRYEMIVADADGENPRVVATSREPLMSPAWSPDRKQLAYVGYERGRSAIYLQDLESGKVDKLVSEKGINGAPAFSPDGQRLAVTLSFENNPDIYVIELRDRSRRRLTDHYGIDTEPAWSPDGSQIVFTSDRGGSPQIYRIPASGGTPERLTFQGRQNLRAGYSPDGRKLALVNADGGRYRIGLYDFETRETQLLTSGNQDESPNFAPNGAVIIYATQGGKAELATVSVDGRVRTRLRQANDIREPAWSPFTPR
jgi:TolB protein